MKRRFPKTNIEGIEPADSSLDFLNGTFGVCKVARIYGVPIRYEDDKWPTCDAHYFSDEEAVI